MAKITKQAEQGSHALATRVTDLLENHDAARKIEIIEFVGAAKLMNKITVSFGSQLLLSLKKFQEEEGYKAYDCKTWVEFLAKTPELDLSKSQYYERIKVLESEGSEVFDLLNSLNVPLSTRKQIGSGDVLIEGEELIIRDQRIPLNDPKKIKRALTQVVEQIERVEAKTAKADKENEKLKKKLAEAKEEARTTALHLPDDGTDPVNQAYLHVLASLTELGRELAELPGKEADQRMAQFKPDIQHAIEILFAFSASNAPTRRPTQQPDGLGLTQAELADLMED